MARVNIEWTDVEQAREMAYKEHLRSKRQQAPTDEEQLQRIERKLDELLKLLS